MTEWRCLETAEPTPAGGARVLAAGVTPAHASRGYVASAQKDQSLGEDELRMRRSLSDHPPGGWLTSDPTCRLCIAEVQPGPRRRAGPCPQTPPHITVIASRSHLQIPQWRQVTSLRAEAACGNRF